MKRVPVESASISSIGYDHGSAILEIEFHSGSLYRYYLVPRRVYEELMSSSSKGRYVNRWVKTAGYPYRKVA